MIVNLWNATWYLCLASQGCTPGSHVRFCLGICFPPNLDLYLVSPFSHKIPRRNKMSANTADQKQTNTNDPDDYTSSEEDESVNIHIRLEKLLELWWILLTQDSSTKSLRTLPKKDSAPGFCPTTLNRTYVPCLFRRWVICVTNHGCDVSSQPLPSTKSTRRSMLLSSVSPGLLGRIWSRNFWETSGTNWSGRTMGKNSHLLWTRATLWCAQPEVSYAGSSTGMCRMWAELWQSAGTARATVGCEWGRSSSQLPIASFGVMIVSYRVVVMKLSRVTGWRPMKPPAAPEADFAVHASVYGELPIRTSPEAERLIGRRRATWPRSTACRLRVHAVPTLRTRALAGGEAIPRCPTGLSLCCPCVTPSLGLFGSAHRPLLPWVLQLVCLVA